MIGSSAPLSGHIAFLGQETRLGAEAYINHVNENGGVHDRKIELIYYDDQYDPPQTVNNTRRLIEEDEVFSLFNYVGTPTSLAIMAIVDNKKIPLIGLFTGSDYLRDPVQDYIFNVRASYSEEAEAAIAYFVDDLGLENIAVLYQDDSFGLSGLYGIQEALKKRNMKTSVYASYKRGSDDIDSAYSKIVQRNPDVVLMVGTYSPLTRFIEKFHENSFNPYFYSFSFVGSEAFSNEIFNSEKILKEEYEKIIVTQVVPSPASTNISLISEYREVMVEEYGGNISFSHASVEGFLNAKILVEALNRTGKDLTRSSFISTLNGIDDYDFGGKANLSFSSTDHQGTHCVFYSRLSDDASFEEFYPEMIF